MHLFRSSPGPQRCPFRETENVLVRGRWWERRLVCKAARPKPHDLGPDEATALKGVCAPCLIPALLSKAPLNGVPRVGFVAGRDEREYSWECSVCHRWPLDVDDLKYCH